MNIINRDDFKKLLHIKENLGLNYNKGIKNLPGFNNVSIDFWNTNVEILTSANTLYTFNISELNAETINNSITHIKTITIELYKVALIARNSTDIVKKWQIISNAEDLQLFDDIIETGGFLSMLRSSMMNNSSLKAIALEIDDNSFFDRYSTIFDDNFVANHTQDIIRKISKYIDDYIEIIAGKLYVFMVCLGFNNSIETTL